MDVCRISHFSLGEIQTLSAKDSDDSDSDDSDSEAGDCDGKI